MVCGGETMVRENYMKILILTTIMAPYRVELFEELGKKIDLTVMFEQKHDTVRDKSWYGNTHKTFDAIYLKKWDKSLRYLKVQVLQQLLRQKPDKVIIYEYSTITAMFLMLCCQILHIPYGINCDGGFVSQHIVKDAIKRYYISHASFCLAGGKLAENYLLSYGAKPDQIQIINFTSLHDADIIEKPLDDKQKCMIREKLGIHEAHVILSVGRFDRGKGFDILLRASSDLPENVGVYIVGGKPTEEYLQIVNQLHLKNVHFIEFADKCLLKQYYLAGDIFVLPTRGDVWGLVINEAMACGLPIITTDHCVAGLELIEEEANGYIIHADDVEGVANSMKRMLNRNNVRLSVGENNIYKIRNYTVEHSAELICRCLRYK